MEENLAKLSLQQPTGWSPGAGDSTWASACPSGLLLQILGTGSLFWPGCQAACDTLDPPCLNWGIVWGCQEPNWERGGCDQEGAQR
jgi:hypothetical protein